MALWSEIFLRKIILMILSHIKKTKFLHKPLQNELCHKHNILKA